jgi:hypothetical protein
MKWKQKLGYHPESDTYENSLWVLVELKVLLKKYSTSPFSPLTGAKHRQVFMGAGQPFYIDNKIRSCGFLVSRKYCTDDMLHRSTQSSAG